ncbi:putative uncharacterized protein [Janthinobacterium agaricidamnosum NBRC 102515 = DSM 9628]|uniref:Uncharacterized protein n=2 Tax=Janthinobacterium agaricidamnosum TaxID=55508 RepID=W0V7H5_9BURK|nr:putative uncharacterized protein [Janthinobacterium agaricidamnosum NBRC 102515 = DSM 9628]
MMADTLGARQGEKSHAMTEQRSLPGAADNSKWNALIRFMRQRDGWTPSYRHKSVDGHISNWEVAWCNHLPFSFLCVEWLDLGIHQRIHAGPLPEPDIINHAAWICPKLIEIGLEHEVVGDIVRIWGHLPKSYDALRIGAGE